MARDLSELGADVFDDTVVVKKSKISSKKRNYIVGLSCVGVFAIALGVCCYLAATKWFIDYNNIEYLVFSYPSDAKLQPGEKPTATIERIKIDSDYPSEFRIPSKIDGIPVTKIADYAFQGASRLEKVIIPDTVTSIGIQSFGACTNLSEFQFSKNLTTIGDDAFLNTSYLNSFTDNDIEVINDCFILHIGTNYFENNTVLLDKPESLPFLPSSFSSYNIVYFSELTDVAITNIANGLFKNNDKLVYCKFPNTIQRLPADVFSYCSNLQCVDLSDCSFNEIEPRTFMNSENLNEIKMAEGVKKIGDFAFQNTGISNVEFISGVTSVGEGIFQDCNNITNVTWPSNLSSIPNYCFKGCSGLGDDSITFANEDNINYIGIGAFQGASFSSFKLPKNINKIFDYTFADCQNLKSIDVFDGVLAYDEDFDEYYADPGLERIYCNAFKNSSLFDTMRVYDANDNYISGKSEEHVINFPTTLTNTDAFAVENGYVFGNTDVKKVNVNEALLTIGDYAFAKSSLNEINFPTSSKLQTIGNGAFIDTEIASINLPDTVIEINSDAFAGCEELTSAHLPENSNISEFSGKGYSNIAAHTFEGCLNLASVNIPSTVNMIDTKAFKGCKSLTELTLNTKISKVGVEAFSDMGAGFILNMPWSKEDFVNKNIYRNYGSGSKEESQWDFCDNTVTLVWAE